MVEREGPAGFVFRPCRKTFGRCARIPWLDSTPAFCTKAPLDAFCSLVIFKMSPRSKHSLRRPGSRSFPPGLCGRMGDHSYLLDEVPSYRPLWRRELPAFFSGRSSTRPSGPRAEGAGARTRRSRWMRIWRQSAPPAQCPPRHRPWPWVGAFPCAGRYLPARGHQSPRKCQALRCIFPVPF